MEKMKLTTDEKVEMEREHNVIIDDSCTLFNINDVESGWRAIPKEWFKTTKQEG